MKHDATRREFLQATCAASVGLAAAGAGAAPAETPRLPQVPFGRHSISRLVCGANPFSAGSHLSVFVNREMSAYFTDEQKLATLRRCEEAGINLWQAHEQENLDLYRRFRDQGLKMQYISLGHEGNGAPFLKDLYAAGCIGVAHHGEVTDNLFKQGKLDEIRRFLDNVRAAGMLAGISTHMPDVVDAVESKGWDLDFYMTCVYERHRSRDDLKKLLGYVPIPVGEVYLQEDPPRMYEMVRRTKRTCLAFKILAAGRLSERKEWVEAAFKQAFESIKPTDAVLVGIYDKHTNQPADNAAFVRRFSELSKA